MRLARVLGLEARSIAKCVGWGLFRQLSPFRSAKLKLGEVLCLSINLRAYYSTSDALSS
jgi:hypothetical protein